MLAFDPVVHGYSYHGRVLRSVTQVLRAAGRVDVSWFTGEAATRGRIVHAVLAACDLADAWPGPDFRIPWPTTLGLPPAEIVTTGPVFGDDVAAMVACPFDLAGYVDAYWRWREMHRPVWTHVEVPRMRLDLDLAGTPDRIGLVERAPAIVEIKTGGPADWHALQTAGYETLDPFTERARWALYLKPNGRFKFRPLDEPGDRMEFLRLAGVVS